jgi:hypothetical protein
VRTVIAMIAALALTCACANPAVRQQVYGAASARIGESLGVLGWNTSMSNLRWQDDYVLVDVDAAPTDAAKPFAAPRDIRFGLYGALAHPIEAVGIGSCDGVKNLVIQSLSAPGGKRLTGTVCLGPMKERAAVRGVYLYSPRDRIAETAAAGSGYMLLGLQADTIAAKYREDSGARGGPMMLLASPTLPPPGLNPACTAYGASVLILPEASLDTVHVNASLCTQGELNDALLYATVSIVGTHAAVWTSK